MHQGLRNVQVNLSSVYEEVQVFKLGQKIATSLPGSPEPVKKKISHKVQSQGGTPVAGSDQIKLPEWKSGLPTPVQGLSQNSTAFTLLEGFAKGNIQMQGKAVRHLQEGNLVRLRNVTIELMEPGGKILGTIKDVNFLEKQNEKIEGNTIGEPTISEILGGLEIDQELKRENIADVCSMGKQKWGRLNPTEPSPASKEAKKKAALEKRKPAPKSGLGSSDKTTPEAAEMMGVLLKANPWINPETGIPRTTEVEKEAIRRLLESRGRGQTTSVADSSSSSEEEASKEKRKREGEEPSEEETKRRTAEDLVVKKKTGGGASKAKKRSKKGGYCGFPRKRKEDPGEENTAKESSLQGRLWEETWRNECQHISSGLSQGPGFYQTDEQGRTFDKYGKRIYLEGETQTVTESSDDDLGVQPLGDVFGMADTDDSDDDETLAEMQKKEMEKK